jgi:hypothetical protein
MTRLFVGPGCKANNDEQLVACEALARLGLS